MRDKLTGLLEIFHKIEEAGGNTPLSLSPPPWEWPRPSLRLCRPPGSTASTASSSPPAPGNQAAGRRRRRNRGAAARARRNQQAATSQVTLAEVVPPPRLPPTPPCRPLRHLLSPTPTSGRRRVMSLGRAEMPTFSTLNLDGSSSPPPAPPPPSPPSSWICYDDCEDDLHCSDCGKCVVLCHDHSGCDCYGRWRRLGHQFSLCSVLLWKKLGTSKLQIEGPLVARGLSYSKPSLPFVTFFLWFSLSVVLFNAQWYSPECCHWSA